MEPVTHINRAVANPIYTGGADRIILNDALYEGVAESTTGQSCDFYLRYLYTPNVVYGYFDQKKII